MLTQLASTSALAITARNARTVSPSRCAHFSDKSARPASSAGRAAIIPLSRAIEMPDHVVGERGRPRKLSRGDHLRRLLGFRGGLEDATDHENDVAKKSYPGSVLRLDTVDVRETHYDREHN
ncbi:MAG: hypothetical protein WBL55_11830 [Xanthobacteraceae bacterium]